MELIILILSLTIVILLFIIYKFFRVWQTLNREIDMLHIAMKVGHLYEQSSVHRQSQ